MLTPDVGMAARAELDAGEQTAGEESMVNTNVSSPDSAAAGDESSDGKYHSMKNKAENKYARKSHHSIESQTVG